jgi:hypothetical protein
MQGSTLAVWEVILLFRSYHGDLKAVAKHLGWPLNKVQAAVNYAEAFPAEMDDALAENAAADLTFLKRMLPQTEEFPVGKPAKRRRT